MARLRRYLAQQRELVPALDRGAVWVLISTAAILILVRSNGNVSAYNRYFGHLFADQEWRTLVPYLYWHACSLLAYVGLPLLICRFALRVPLVETGLGLGDARFGLRAVLLLYAGMLPFVGVATLMPVFVDKYPLSPYVAGQALALAEGTDGLWWVVASYEAGYAAYFLGWEFLFRGYLTLVLARYIGPIAVVVQVVPFALLHVGKPQPEALGSIVAGLALGLLALRTRSVWWGFLLHAAIAITMDGLALLARLARS